MHTRTVPAGMQGDSLALRATLRYRKLPQSVADRFHLGETPIIDAASAEAEIAIK